MSRKPRWDPYPHVLVLPVVVAPAVFIIQEAGDHWHIEHYGEDVPEPDDMPLWLGGMLVVLIWAIIVVIGY